MDTFAVMFESCDFSGDLSDEGPFVVDAEALDGQAHEEDRFIAGFLKHLGSRRPRVRQLAKRLAQEALDDILDLEGRIDHADCASLDVVRLFARCSTLCSHNRAPARERRRIVQAFSEYVRAFSRTRTIHGRPRTREAGMRNQIAA
jgi:hypothetical protein